MVLEAVALAVVVQEAPARRLAAQEGRRERLQRGALR
jgi:hypothetical protein